MDAVTLGAAQAAVRASTLRAPLDLSAGDITVTLAQVRSRVLDLTGATAARTVTFPDAPFTCRVTNSTDYLLTLKRSGGTKTIALDAGGSIELVS